ncbi:hypothetical protein [Cupriavidus nantongensis]|uniref:hypothetical protein n=1 Tax=Cupriavidus nantongensis TaxID=1796606 RepID=UPI00358F10B5
MSLTYMLEVEGGLSRGVMKSALLACGASIFSEDEAGFSGNFLGSNMFFLYRDRTDLSPSQVLAELVPSPLHWRVGSRVSLDAISSKFDECRDEIIRLLQELERRSAAHFVLSFQYEEVYAIRDEDGLHLYGNL